jgi:hypothetical protein
MNDTYGPSFIVRQTHDILHLDSSLHEVDNTFNITVNSFLNDYTQSLIPIPAILMSLGLLAIVVLFVVHFIQLCRRCCCDSSSSNQDALTEAIHSNGVKNANRYGFIGICFFVFLVLTLLADQILLFGNESLSDGVNTAKDAVNYMDTLSSTLLDQGYVLQNYGTVLTTDFQSASSGTSCTIPSQYLTYIDDYNTYIQEFVDTVSPIPGQCSDVHDGLDKWGITYKNQTIWVLYAFLLLLVFIYGIGACFKQACPFYTAMIWSELWMIIIFIAVGVELVILVVVSHSL